MSIEISVNGERKTLEQPGPLSDLLTDWGFSCDRVAVAVNEEFVPRSRYGSYQLQDRDQVDVVAPVQGG